MTADRHDILAWIAREVPKAVQAELDGKLDTCVLSTRIGYDICRYFGIDAKPAVVRAIAYNQEWADFATEHELSTVNDAKWADAWQTGAWAIGIDEEDRNEKGRFAGHLVLVCPNATSLDFLDLSAGQFRREEHAMMIPDAIHMTVPEGFLDEEVVTFESDDGSAVMYRHRPGVSKFRRGGDWRLSNPISGALIRKAKSDLAITTNVV